MLDSTHQTPYWIVDPNMYRAGATVTVSSRMAQSRYGSAGELLAWRPIMWDTRAIKVVSRGVTPVGPLARERSVQTYNEDSDAILESASRRKTLKWHYSRPL